MPQEMSYEFDKIGAVLNLQPIQADQQVNTNLNRFLSFRRKKQLAGTV